LQNLTPRKISQRLLLDAYRQRPKIATAARLAGIHRCTVYRWQADPEFAKAMRKAEEEFTAEWRAKTAAEQAARKRWREERERARRPMRCRILAIARAARKKRGRKWW
jgi:hypothetical protein